MLLKVSVKQIGQTGVLRFYQFSVLEIPQKLSLLGEYEIRADDTRIPFYIFLHMIYMCK